MVWGGMRQATHQNAWAAAFLAIVLKLMAPPMASVLDTLSLEQLLSGSFCSSGSAQQIALSLGKEPSTSAHSGNQAHCCCSRSISAAPLASQPPQLPRFIGLAVRVSTLLSLWISPRNRWPSINPRASPTLCMTAFFQHTHGATTALGCSRL